jgi:hypothetical protein
MSLLSTHARKHPRYLLAVWLSLVVPFGVFWIVAILIFLRVI